MSTAFVSPNDYLELFPDASTVGLVAMLDEACDKVRAYLSQQVDLVTNDVVAVYGSDTRALLLPELPVVSVASVVGDGTAVTDFTSDRYGILWRTPPAYWARPSVYTVTYTHGWSAQTLPAVIRSAACRLARAASANPGGVSQESVAGYSASYTTDETTLSVLDPWMVKRVPVP